MATYSEAEAFVRGLKPIIDQCIANHPLVKSAIKAQKAVVWTEPDTEKHTVGIKFLPDIFDGEEGSAIPKSPKATSQRGEPCSYFTISRYPTG